MKLIILPLLFVIFFAFETANCVTILSQDVVECKTNGYTLTVAQSGGANFTTVEEAIKSIPEDNEQWVKIAISPGIYTEQIQIINVQCIFLEGQDRKSTIITFNAHDSTDTSITFDAFTNNFVAKGITFRNSYNLSNKKNVAPAVAFRAYGDKQAFYNCGFEGYQDTLWDDFGRHYYESCYIEGATDFIWGSGGSVYQSCSINVTDAGYITAQGKQKEDDISGYVFKGCNIYGEKNTMLGRAYAPFSSVVLIDTNIADIVNPEGWFIWTQTGHEGDVTYAEVNCKGGGANTSGRVKWMKTISDPSVYDTKNYIDKDGWIEKLP